MDDSLKFSRISWIITVFVILGNFFQKKLLSSPITILGWGVIALFVLIIGVICGAKGYRVIVKCCV